MSKARYLPKADYDRLKSASRDAVQIAGGLKRVVEFITRGSMGRLSEAISPDCDGRFPAIDQVADIEAQIGKPIITAVLADMLGCDLTPREASPVTRAPEELLGDAIQQAADVPTTFLKSGKDGWTRTKKDLLRVQIAEAQDALERLDEWAAADVEPTLRAVG